MRRDWTQIGESTGIARSRIEAAISHLEWQKLPYSASMMAGEAIKAAVKQFRIPKVSAVAESPELAPFGFYGIRAKYANGAARVYIVDEGTHCTPVAIDFDEA